MARQDPRSASLAASSILDSKMSWSLRTSFRSFGSLALLCIANGGFAAGR